MTECLLRSIPCVVRHIDMSVHSDALMSSELECCHLGIDHLGQINVWLMRGGSRGVLDAVRRDPLGRPQKKKSFPMGHVFYFAEFALAYELVASGKSHFF